MMRITTPPKLMQQALDKACQTKTLNRKTKARFLVTTMAKKVILVEFAPNPKKIKKTNTSLGNLCIND